MIAGIFVGKWMIFLDGRRNNPVLEIGKIFIQFVALVVCFGLATSSHRGLASMSTQSRDWESRNTWTWSAVLPVRTITTIILTFIRRGASLRAGCSISPSTALCGS
jgi:hypothetical protein